MSRKEFLKKLNAYLKRQGVTNAPFDVEGENWYIDFDEINNTIYTGPKVNGEVIKKVERDYSYVEGWPMSDVLEDLYFKITHSNDTHKELKPLYKTIKFVFNKKLENNELEELIKNEKLESYESKFEIINGTYYEYTFYKSIK